MESLEPGIVVMGRGEARARPDVVRVVIGVNVTRPSVAQATADAARAADAVLAALRNAGVADDDLQTAQMTLQPNYDYPPGGGARLAGYTFANTVAAVVRDLDATPAILDAAVAAGGDDTVLQGISFGLDDDGAAEVDARAAAWADAADRARQLAGLAGLSLGPALAVEESTGQQAEPRMMMAAARSARADAGGPPPVAAGQLTTTVTIRVRFSLGT